MYAIIYMTPNIYVWKLVLFWKQYSVIISRFHASR